MCLQDTIAHILILHLLILALVVFVILKSWRLKFCRGHLFSNAVKIMLFILGVQYYVPMKLCRTAGSIHLFKTMWTWTPENIKLKQNWIWNVTELDWEEIIVTLNGNNINLPNLVAMKFRVKFKIRHIVKENPCLFNIMLKQGITWFTVASNNCQETV